MPLYESHKSAVMLGTASKDSQVVVQTLATKLT